MTADDEAGRRRFEPFDPKRHDRATLSTGVAQVDNFFRKSANKLAKADNLRVTVLVQPDGTLIGFHAINVYSIDYRELPPRYARTRPAHGNIPVAFISMIGVDHRFQGRGMGTDLLFDCLLRVVRASEILGIALVMLDVLDCGDTAKTESRKKLYVSYGFTPLPDQPLRLYLPIASARELTDHDKLRMADPRSTTVI